MEDLRIRWGIFIKANGEVLGYEVDSRAGISAISRSGNTSSEIKKEMNYADPGKFCKVVSMVRNEIIKMQALNAPGDTSKFIELINPGSNMTFRAIWNPQFVTIANKGFSEAYDSLNALIKEK